MDKLKVIIAWLQILIFFGCIARYGYCHAAQTADPDEEKTYKVRRRNLLVFFALSQTIAGLLQIILKYF